VLPMALASKRRPARPRLHWGRDNQRSPSSHVCAEINAIGGLSNKLSKLLPGIF
jgi:hypothetical protein